MLSREKLVVIPQVYNERSFDWLGPVVFPIWGFFMLNLVSLD